jgi:K+-transporting ATPase KdpF subunit
MGIEYAVGGFFAAALLVYLICALLWPDRF